MFGWLACNPSWKLEFSVTLKVSKLPSAKGNFNKTSLALLRCVLDNVFEREFKFKVYNENLVGFERLKNCEDCSILEASANCHKFSWEKPEKTKQHSNTNNVIFFIDEDSILKNMIIKDNSLKTVNILTKCKIKALFVAMNSIRCSVVSTKGLKKVLLINFHEICRDE